MMEPFTPSTPRTDLTVEQVDNVITVAIGLMHRAGVKATIQLEPNGDKIIRIKSPTHFSGGKKSGRKSGGKKSGRRYRA